MNLNLKDKNGLVGGGSKGIGLGSAMELALLGANVINTDFEWTFGDGHLVLVGDFLTVA